MCESFQDTEIWKKCDHWLSIQENMEIGRSLNFGKVDTPKTVKFVF